MGTFRLAMALAVTLGVAAAPTGALALNLTEIAIIAGGASDPSSIDYAPESSDRTVPELPVTYEDAAGGAQSGSD